MHDKQYIIRAMTRSELDIAVEWASNEGWNPGLYDADSFFAAGSNGFLALHDIAYFLPHKSLPLLLFHGRLTTEAGRHKEENTEIIFRGENT